MQYVLSQDEYDDLVSPKRLENATNALIEARKHILSAYDYECIHESGRKEFNYCDDCPVGEHSHEVKDLLCALSKNYSK